jgi:membrane protease YdiL (CAAX protease family)
MATTLSSESHDTQQPLAVAGDHEFGGQYSLGKILAIWFVVAAPMGLIMWWIVPVFIAPTIDFAGLPAFLLLTGGLVWQFLVAAFILFREVKPFTWPNIRRRLWLTKPVNPRSGRPSKRMLWWALPIAAATVIVDQLGPLALVEKGFVDLFPAISPPAYGIIQNLARPENVGQWWILGVLAVTILFNYLLGEELIFRGILLPKMKGVFGRWDVLANGLLFATYHVHMIWTLPSQILTDWVYAWGMKRYRSYWVSVIIHSVDAIFLVVLFPLAIAGIVTA